MKKWQKLVSNHFKNLSKPVDSPANVSRASTPIPQVNGIAKESTSLLERPQSSFESQKKSGIKRKHTSVSGESYPVDEKIRTQHITLCEKPTALICLGKGLINAQKNNVSGSSESTAVIRNGQCIDRKIEPERLKNSNLLLPEVVIEITQNQTNLNSPQVEDEKEKTLSNNNDIDESEWLEVQINQLQDEHFDRQGSTADSYEPPCDISVEDLEVKRKPLMENYVNPTEEADGINGCYDEDGKWCYWTDLVIKKQGTLPIHPYVTLD